MWATDTRGKLLPFGVMTVQNRARQSARPVLEDILATLNAKRISDVALENHGRITAVARPAA